MIGVINDEAYFHNEFVGKLLNGKWKVVKGKEKEMIRAIKKGYLPVKEKGFYVERILNDAMMLVFSLPPFIGVILYYMYLIVVDNEKMP